MSDLAKYVASLAHIVKGASKVSLSSLSSPTHWEKTGRYEKVGSEVRSLDSIACFGLEMTSYQLFQFQDRFEEKFLLSPTHEEEITSLVKGLVGSYRELPLRLYQVCKLDLGLLAIRYN